MNSRVKREKLITKVSSAPLVEKKYYDDAVALANAKLVQIALPWVALENFRLKQARDADWMMLQYWLYYTEYLITMYLFESLQEHAEVYAEVQNAIQALYAGGRRFNESKFKDMSLTVEECDCIRNALLIGDELKSVTDEVSLLLAGRHTQKILSVPKGK